MPRAAQRSGNEAASVRPDGGLPNSAPADDVHSLTLGQQDGHERDTCPQTRYKGNDGQASGADDHIGETISTTGGILLPVVPPVGCRRGSYRPRDNQAPTGLLDFIDRHLSAATEDTQVLKRYLIVMFSMVVFVVGIGGLSLPIAGGIGIAGTAVRGIYGIWRLGVRSRLRSAQQVTDQSASQGFGPEGARQGTDDVGAQSQGPPLVH